MYAGTRRGLGLGPQRLALFEVGMTATRAVLGDAQQALLASSLEIGVLRLRDHWLAGERASHAAALAGEWVRTVIAPTVARFQAAGFDVLALTSPTMLALGRLAGRRLAGLTGDGYELTLEGLTAWEPRLASNDNPVPALGGLDAYRTDRLLPAAVIARAIMQMTRVKAALIGGAVFRVGATAEQGPRLPTPVPAAADQLPRLASSST
jgi:exopolyphosphatase/pppGpp-phosphohydrolase